ncbi:RhoGAP domain containing protein [Trichomonas vaginalis G3]|uniref:RhoGAP domain containing protein n=1 Tax=Trichomonas vaginalis (strain ATCC PRA-98 / G3) TaxID=412133 RepID=A2EQ22_TRIV3|nr:GTPase activator protein [Trichomonas vaginalis G3]EAY05197.1 RhoGAP domain containing protein [Trichomonas vaginalis G3]KAI5543921.1 GTPase activator protein [Trichomonas vaginalis G3]|eukprot:XP_001317420.1 RhoGAP domain containing protein [Trichomonas vaginalis G3]
MNRRAPRFFSRQPEQFGGKIPFIVTDIIDELRKQNATDAEGIFRLSGSAAQVTELLLELDSGRVKDWSKYNSVHTIACTLKKYFREMIPNYPLFPHSIYGDLQDASNQANKQIMIEKYKASFEKLSKPRQLTIAYLFKYILEIEENKAKNKMNAVNLAIVFSQNLLCSLDTSKEATLINNAIQNKIIQTLIDVGHQVFDDINTDGAILTDDDMPIIAIPPVPKSDIEKFIMLRDIRRRSYIPYIPADMFRDPRFVRPTRTVVFDKVTKKEKDTNMKLNEGLGSTDQIVWNNSAV